MSGSQRKEDLATTILSSLLAFLKMSWPNASTSSPEESLLVFLWCCAHFLSLGHMIVFFGYSRLWLLRVWNGVLQDI